MKRLLVAFLAFCLIFPASLSYGQTSPQPSDLQSSDTPVVESQTSHASSPLARVIHEEKTETPIAKGLTLTDFTRFDTEGWLKGNILRVNLTEETISTSLLTAGGVTNTAPISRQVRESSAVAGVNGDFFDIGNTNAPIGVEVADGKLLKSGPSNWLSASVSQDRIGQITNSLLLGSVEVHTGTYRLDGINTSSVGQDQLIMYTSAWGEASRSHILHNQTDTVEVLLKNDQVLQVLDNEIYAENLLEDEVILSGKGNAAHYLRELSIGDTVLISYSTSPSFADLMFAVGSNAQLVQNGEISTTNHTDRHPRTALGFSADGTEMIIATIDGRQRDSRGMTLLELAHLMREAGAWNALNLDGGGSTTLAARELGKENIKVFNTPSDGFERAVPNGVGIWSQARTGVLDGFAIETNSTRVFQGLSRVFHAYAYDDVYAPMDIQPGDVHWQGRSAGQFTENVFTARQAGKHEILARYKGTMTTKDIHVLGDPVSLTLEPRQIGLEKGETASFMVIGEDEEGYTTYIEPRDIHLVYDQSLLSITPQEEGSFTVHALADSGASLVTASVGDLNANLGVTVGLETTIIDNFEDQTNPWTFFKFPAEVRGSLEYVQNEETDGQALRLNYDFTTSTRTRAAYMFPPTGRLSLNGDVKKLGLRVYGNEGNGHWLRARILDNARVYHVLDLHFTVDWQGWRYVETDIPAGVEYPISLDRIYLVETDPTKQDTGYIMVDDLQIKVAQQLEKPKQDHSEDPIILKYGSLPEDHWTFAVLSDLHLISSSPNSTETQHAIQVLEALNQQDVDFVVFNGDVIDYDTDAEYRYAKELIDQHLEKPYYVLPGNHELYGTNNLNNYQRYFGPDHQVFDHKGTKFILMNTSTGSLRTSNPEQWFMLKAAIEAAKTDDTIQNVILIGHHPLQDPLPDGARALGERKEAELLETWITDLRETTGKGAIMISGHAHLVNVDRRDGIPYLIVGPNGKGAYGAPDDGGFYNYAVFAVNPEWKADKRLHYPSYQGVSKNPWVLADIRPILHNISLEETQYVVGQQTEMNWIGHQAGVWTFPLRYPATIRYTGSENLLISSEMPASNSEYTAVFNPEDQTITFLQAGIVTIELESGGYRKAFELSTE